MCRAGTRLARWRGRSGPTSTSASRSAERARCAEVVFELAGPAVAIDFAALTGDARMEMLGYFNPPGYSSMGVVNTPEWRSAEVPSTNGHGTARGLARFYAALLEPGRLLSVDLLAEATPHSVGGLLPDPPRRGGVRPRFQADGAPPPLRSQPAQLRALRHRGRGRLRRSRRAPGLRLRHEPRDPALAEHTQPGPHRRRLRVAGAVTFEELVAEGAAVPVEGWDFSWFAGRATEERPPWGYARLMGERMAGAAAALDIETGGGEVLAGIGASALLVGGHGVLAAQRRRGPGRPAPARRPRRGGGRPARAALRGGLVRPGGEPASRRHPVGRDRPGPATRRHLPVPADRARHQPRADRVLPRPHAGQRSAAGPNESPRRPRAAGLEVVRLESCALRVEFFDVAAVVYFLRKVLWTVPGFTPEAYEPELRRLHAQIEREGSFVSTAQRFLIEARRLA